MKWSEVALLGFLALSLVLVGATVVGSLQEAQDAGDNRTVDRTGSSDFVLPTPRPADITATAAVQVGGEDAVDADEQDGARVPLPTLDCTDPTADC